MEVGDVLDHCFCDSLVFFNYILVNMFVELLLIPLS